MEPGFQAIVDCIAGGPVGTAAKSCGPCAAHRRLLVAGLIMAALAALAGLTDVLGDA